MKSLRKLARNPELSMQQTLLRTNSFSIRDLPILGTSPSMISLPFGTDQSSRENFDPLQFLFQIQTTMNLTLRTFFVEWKKSTLAETMNHHLTCTTQTHSPHSPHTTMTITADTDLIPVPPVKLRTQHSHPLQTQCLVLHVVLPFFRTPQVCASFSIKPRY